MSKLNLKPLGFMLIGCSLLILNQNCGDYSSHSMEKALASAHSSSILDVELPSYKARVGDRIFTSSVLADVYLKRGQSLPQSSIPSSVSQAAKLHLSPYITEHFDASADNSILKVIEDKVLKQTFDFSGSCNILEQDTSCITSRGLTDDRQQELALSSISPVTSVREGFRISACVDISKIDAAVENIIFNATGSVDTVFDVRQHTDDVFELFYPAQTMAGDAYNAIWALVDRMKMNGEKNFDVWRNLSLAICKTPGWQIP